ncbi:hypothetical protein SPD79_12130 [Oceanobacillus sp. SE10311]
MLVKDKDNAALKAGLNVVDGKVTFEVAAHDLGYEYVSADEALAAQNH